jgi:hypothetical protein
MSSSLTLGQQMLRSASIFQAIAAISTAFIQGLWLIDLFYTSWSGYRLYDCLFVLPIPSALASLTHNSYSQDRDVHDAAGVWHPFLYPGRAQPPQHTLLNPVP